MQTHTWFLKPRRTQFCHEPHKAEDHGQCSTHRGQEAEQGGFNPHVGVSSEQQRPQGLSETWQMRGKAGAVPITPAPQSCRQQRRSMQGTAACLLTASDDTAKTSCLRDWRDRQIELWPEHFIMQFLFQTQPHTYPAFQRQVLCTWAPLDIIGIQKLKIDYCFNFTQNLCRAAGQHGLDP